MKISQILKENEKEVFCKCDYCRNVRDPFYIDSSADTYKISQEVKFYMEDRKLAMKASPRLKGIYKKPYEYLKLIHL